MTEQQPPTDNALVSAVDTSQLIQNINTALMQADVYRRGVFAMGGREPSEDSMIQVGKESFAVIETRLRLLEAFVIDVRDSKLWAMTDEECVMAFVRLGNEAAKLLASLQEKGEGKS